MICEAVNHKTQFPAFTISIGLCYDQGHDSTHSGIVYNIANRAFFIHMAWHQDIRLDDESTFSSNGRFICTPIRDLETLDSHKEISKSLISILRTTQRKYGNSFPYATMYNGGFFSSEPPYDFVGPENGLTCATFVLSILKSKDIILVDADTWEHRASDEEWRDFIIKMLTKHGASPIHIQSVRDEKYSVRFRPEEVFVSAIQAGNSNFEFCEHWGQIIKAQMQKNVNADEMNSELALIH